MIKYYLQGLGKKVNLKVIFLGFGLKLLLLRGCLLLLFTPARNKKATSEIYPLIDQK
jgi:hypothetical protein